MVGKTSGQQETPGTADVTHQGPQGRFGLLALSALGVVFGDIGTSPLYTFKTILGAGEQTQNAA
ncbi:MAG TPA: KUP/HAK/KT family potassium transporter, partial [Bradyrhizobium sp.]|nr:KUP/HAK/KT family potassium transporter [Bradyrhizobium sp.]